MLEDDSKADVAYRILFAIQALCREEGYQGRVSFDGMKGLTLLAGLYVETAYLFDNCEEALQGSFQKLSLMLGAEPLMGGIADKAMPPPMIIDFDAEMGRAMAREFFEEFLDCQYEFHQTLLDMTHHLIVQWEQYGQARAESLRLLVELTYRAMCYELAAQELCDVVIEKQIGVDGWAIADSIAGLAGLAGRALSLSHGGRNQCCWFRGSDLPDLLDQTAYVMTQEAVRLGTPTGTDWRFGLPANDVPVSAPTDLVNKVERLSGGFFKALDLYDYDDQAVCAAKAAGRMLAVACAGERPDIEPAIAKPLAMAALTETYKSACVEYAAVSV